MSEYALQSQGLILKFFHLFLVLTGANECYIRKTHFWKASAPAVSKDALYLQMSLLVHEPVTCLREFHWSYWNLTLKLSFIVLLVMFLSVTDCCVFCWLWYSLIDH